MLVKLVNIPWAVSKSKINLGYYRVFHSLPMKVRNIILNCLTGVQSAFFPAIGTTIGQFPNILLADSLTNVALPEIFVAILAFRQRVGKTYSYAPKPPKLWVHQNRRIYAVNIASFQNKIIPPRIFDVVFLAPRQADRNPMFLLIRRKFPSRDTQTPFS